MGKGIGRYHIDKAEDSKSKILNALGSGEWVRYSDIVKRTGLGTTTVSKFLKIMERTGEIEKKVDLESGEYPYPALYRITDKGRNSLEAILKVKEAEQTYPVELKDFTRLLKERCSKTLRYLASLMDPSPLKRVLRAYITSITLGIFTPAKKEDVKKIEEFITGLACGTRLAVCPPPENDERSTIEIAIIELLGKIMENRSYRDKIANNGKLTIFLNIDLNEINLPTETKSEALFWALAFEGLLREGKISNKAH